MAFDDVSVPLPPMRSPDIRSIIMEEAEALCVEAGITDITFICSVALHRFIRCVLTVQRGGAHVYTGRTSFGICAARSCLTSTLTKAACSTPTRWMLIATCT